MEGLINKLIKQEYLKTPIIIDAFHSVRREDFVLLDLKRQAYTDVPLPIGWGQTISQPMTVAFMLELLQPQPGDKILDIGAGSGWQTALLAYIVSKRKPGHLQEQNLGKSPLAQARTKFEGKVFAIERIKELYEFGKKNLEKYNFIKKGIVELMCKDGSRGLKTEAPFDKIIAAASAEKIPQAWKDQLKIGGRLVTPVSSSIWLLIKKSETEFEEKEFSGFSFVPLIEEE